MKHFKVDYVDGNYQIIPRKSTILSYFVCLVDYSISPCIYTKTDLVFGFSKNQILVAVIPGQKAPRTLLRQNCFWIIAENHFEMSILRTTGIYERFTGRVTTKFVPVPGMFLTSIFPLCKSTMCFTIDNHKPVPPSFLDLDVSTT